MIPWEKFRLNEEPTYSDHVYRPTPRILANHVPFFQHQAKLLNASPLQNADDRRFVISQWSPDQRAQHFSTFHASHTVGIEAAIDLLVGYFEKHELKPLSAYDHDGWPASYDSKGDYVDGQMSVFEERRPRDQQVETVFHTPSHPGLKGGVEQEHSGLKNNRSPGDSSEFQFDYEEIYDFPSSLAGMTLDSVDSLFGTEGTFNPERVFAPELSLSATPTYPPSPSQKPQLNDLLSIALQSLRSPATAQEPSPTLPPLTVCPTATTQTSLPPTLTSTTHANSHPTLSIANLIHPNASPDVMSASSTSGPNPSDPEIIKLLSNPNINLFATTLRASARANFWPQPPSPTSKSPAATQSGRDHVDALRQGLLPIPLRGSRTYKALRMRRDSRERAETRSRRVSGAKTEREKMRLGGEHGRRQERAKHRRPDSSGHSDASQGHFQPYSYEYGGADWSQPIERASTISTTSYAVDYLPKDEEHDRCAAHQLPTSAIKYEPLDDLKLMPEHHQPRQQNKNVSLKRKERDDDNDHAGPSSRPRLGSNSWTFSGAPHWPAVARHAPSQAAPWYHDEQESTTPKRGYRS